MLTTFVVLACIALAVLAIPLLILKTVGAAFGLVGSLLSAVFGAIGALFSALFSVLGGLFGAIAGLATAFAVVAFCVLLVPLLVLGALLVAALPVLIPLALLVGLVWLLARATAQRPPLALQALPALPAR